MTAATNTATVGAPDTTGVPVANGSGAQVAHSQVANGTGTHAPNGAEAQAAPCYLLTHIPPEVRKVIYGFLLTDTLLSTVTPFYPGPQPEGYEESVDSDDTSSKSEDTEESDDSEEDDADVGSDGLIDLGDIDDDEDPEDRDDLGSDSLTHLGDVDDIEDSEISEATDSVQYTESIEDSEVDGEDAEVEDSVIDLPPIPKFDLSPAILRTCRKIYREALPVLYRSNRFAVGIFCDKLGQSPILRGRNPEWRFPREYDADTVPGFKRIRHWRVIMCPSAYAYEGSTPSGLLNFCRALCDSDVQSLEVWVIREDIKMLKRELRIDKNGLVETLQPLDILRNLTRLDIKEANIYYNLLDLPKLLESGVEWPGKPTSAKRSSIILDETKSQLQHLTQGNSSVLRLFRSLNRLTTYVKTFESNDKHKSHMVQQLSGAKLLRDTNNWSWPGLIADFKQPLEDLLCFAIVAGGEEDIKEFCDVRTEVIALLEPQYGRMVSAAKYMENFSHLLKVKAWKEGLHNVNHAKTCLTAKRHVKLWAILSERDTLAGRRGKIEAESPLGVVTSFASLHRQKLFKKMRKLETDLQSIKRCKRYMGLFRQLAVHIHSQFLEARKARDLLFDSDDFEAVVEAEGRPYVDWITPNKAIDWTIQRPPVDPCKSLTCCCQHDNEDEAEMSGIGEQNVEGYDTPEYSTSSDGGDDDERIDPEAFKACKRKRSAFATMG